MQPKTDQIFHHINLADIRNIIQIMLNERINIINSAIFRLFPSSLMASGKPPEYHLDQVTSAITILGRWNLGQKPLFQNVGEAPAISPWDKGCKRTLPILPARDSVTVGKFKIFAWSRNQELPCPVVLIYRLLIAGIKSGTFWISSTWGAPRQEHNPQTSGVCFSRLPRRHIIQCSIGNILRHKFSGKSCFSALTRPCQHDTAAASPKRLFRSKPPSCQRE